LVSASWIVLRRFSRSRSSAVRARPNVFLALGFSLLELDVFTLEAASHSPVF
jgi:hypothetical protein